MDNKWEDQIERITKISKFLRLEYFKANETADSYFDTPSGGLSGNGEKYDMVGSIGAWPEFIMRGTFCCRTFKGFCSPCFYSQFSLKNKITGDNYREMVRKQFTYVLENYDKEVYQRQYGWPFINKSNDKKIEFVLTPTGSYFDRNEFPQDLRIEMLEGILSASKKFKEPVYLRIESHCRDWLALDFEDELTKKEISLLQKLNTTVLFGFESADEYVRNVLYNKHLDMDEVLRTYELFNKYGLKMGVFIFAGLFSMNDYLTYIDVEQSLNFAINKGIAPVLMFQNVQTNTINEVLFKDNQICLTEPFTVMDIISRMIALSEDSGSATEWLIADPKGGPPAPEFNIFECAHITPKDYCEIIYDSVVNLRLTRNTKEFQEVAKEIRKSYEYQKYKEWYNCLGKRDTLEARTTELLDCTENILKDRGYK